MRGHVEAVFSRIKESDMRTSIVVRLRVVVHLGELVEALAVDAHHNPAVGQQSVVRFERAHIVEATVGHCSAVGDASAADGELKLEVWLATRILDEVLSK